MAHGLMDCDWMLSVKERPWHGIGTVVEDAPTSDEAIKMAKLDWKVKQYQVNANGIVLPGYYANIRTDANIPLGVVKERYKIVQNNEAFDFVDDIVKSDEVECRYETAGSLWNGKRIFLLVKLPNQNLLGDDVENYLFFTNSHDGTSSLMAGITNVRVVCNNTLQLAMKEAKRVWRCRHTLNIKDKQLQAKESLGFAVKYLDDMGKVAEELVAKKIDEERFFRELFATKKLATMNEKNREEVVTRMHLIYNEKDDLQNFKGTAWGMYNAIADYCSNTVPLRQTKTYAENKLADFFDGNVMLQTAQDLLMVA